jgi:predicted NBD/HSP70 family sugar kinase
MTVVNPRPAAPGPAAVASATPLRTLAPARVARAGEVLQLIRRGSASTISELAGTMRLARSTISERVDLLVELGLVMPQGEVVLGRGRPATALAFNGAAGVVLTAQLGMSGIRVGVSDLAGTILVTRSADVEIGLGPDEVLSRLEAELDRALDDAGRTREHVFGIGIPGRIELETAPGIGSSRPWREFPIEQRLTSAFGVPAVVGRGTSLLSVAEHHDFHPDADVLLGVKAGTVIECGVVIDGRIIPGRGGLVGEIGHTPVAGSDALCVCGNSGCLNAVAGGAALVRSLTGQGYPVDSARDVAVLAQEGVVAAGQAVREAGRQIGEVLAGAVNLLNPDVIVVWGYLADAGEQLFAGIRESLYRDGVPAATQHLALERARLGDDAGIRGAATTVIEQVLSPAQVDQLVLDRLGAR